MYMYVLSANVSRKMMPVLQWIVGITILISVTYLPGASSELSDGVTQHINVSLPTTDCTHPSCFTWSECLMDPSQCFSSHSNVTLLPGEYPLHQYLLVRDVASLSIYGGVSVSGHARDNQVVINCNDTAGGIGFFNVTDFVLSGITLVSCGVSGADIVKDFSLSAALSIMLGPQMMSNHYALHMFDGINVNLKRVFITNSSQTGLLCISVLGTSRIEDSVFTHSNYGLLEDYMRGEVRCSKGEQKCVGKNVWVVILDNINFYTNYTKVDFIIEGTEISYGVNLTPANLLVTGSAGVGIFLGPQLRYELHRSITITISNCSFRYNIGKRLAHLCIGILGNSSVLVKDCSFTYANRMNSDIVQAIYPNEQTVKFYVTVPVYEFTFIINVTVTMRNVSITENYGGGLIIQSEIAPHVSQTNVHTVVEGMKITHNYIPGQAKNCTAIILIELRGFPACFKHMITSLELLEISNNQFELEDGKLRNEGCLTVWETEVHLNKTVFYNNSVSAIHTGGSDLHFHGVNIFRNNTGVCGGALTLNQGSLMYLHPGAQIYIIENTGLKYGGGICVDNGIVTGYISTCFYQILDPAIFYHDNNFIYMEGNRATITGYSIFGGPVYGCRNLLTYHHKWDDTIFTFSKRVFKRVFHLIPQNTSLGSWYEVSSEPYAVCFCSNQSKQPLCDIHEMTTSVYPGQTIKVWAVGVGQGDLFGIVPAIVKIRTDSQYNIFPEVQRLGNACEPLNYTVLAPEGLSGITVIITVERNPIILDLPRHLIITTLHCPQGFVLQQSECGCHPMLRRVSVECEIDTRTFTRLGSVWIGMDSENKGLLTHMHCPNAYCKLQQVEFELDTPDAQCASDHSGILCGGCKDGFALMLGSSRCHQCDNKYLALLLTFVAAGLLLVLTQGRVDITVASGTMNGVLFYTNVVKASSDAVISSFISKHFAIIIAWLNLDLGIEVCFSSHLDMFWKSLLQYAFPLYIWLLVAAIIVLSRYSTVAARLSGRNTVPVLATLFLLSYAKVLDTIIAAFSFTSIETEKNGPLVVWLHDGNLKYMQGKHIALVLVSSLFAIFYIFPLTLLLLFAPALQRISHYRVVRLVQRLKPILDAFQGPYKDKFRWWPGLMLVVRIILFIALTANTTHDPRRSVLLVALAVSTLIPVGLIWSGGVYKNRLLIILETALYSNLLVFAVWSLFNYSAYGNKAELSKHQQAAAYTMISIFYALLMGVLFYHIAKKLTDLGIPGYLLNFIRRRCEPQGDGEGEEIEMRGRQNSGCDPVAPPPTVTVVDLRELREPLLTD